MAWPYMTSATLTSPFTMLASMLIIFFLIIGFTGNGMIIFIILRHKNMRAKPNNTYVLLLAVGDLLVRKRFAISFLNFSVFFCYMFVNDQSHISVTKRRKSQMMYENRWQMKLNASTYGKLQSFVGMSKLGQSSRALYWNVIIIYFRRHENIVQFNFPGRCAQRTLSYARINTYFFDNRDMMI